MDNDGKVTQLKNMIYKYIYDENIDIYIKLQTFFEFLIKDYISTGLYFPDNFEELRTTELINEYASEYSRLKEVNSILKVINRKANAGLKHYNDLIVFYDEKIIKEAIFEINHLNNFLFENNSKYHIDENIFRKSNISVLKSYTPPPVLESSDIITEIKMDFFNLEKRENKNPAKTIHFMDLALLVGLIHQELLQLECK